MVKRISKRKAYDTLFRDLFLVTVSVFVSIWIIRLGLLQNIVSVLAETKLLAAFISGIFFTSAFTIAPAAIVLAGLSTHVPIISFAFWGACGALVGDLTIFLLVRDRFAEDIMDVLKATKAKKISHFFHKGFFRWLSPIIGAIVIVSPLPDEVGLTMMGFAKTKLALLIPISFTMNFIAVLLVAGIAGVF